MSEPTNFQRGGRGLRALMAYAKAQGTTIEEKGTEAVAIDLLADLMHYFTYCVEDFDDCLRIARGHFEEEFTSEEKFTEEEGE